MGPQGSLSATNLAVHHHLNCDLYLHNVYHKKNPRPSTSTAIQDASEKALLEARYKRGLEWESTLYSWLDESNLLLKVPSTPVEAGILMENILADDRDHFFITGLTFKAPADQLVRRFAQHGHDPVNFGLAKPDLIEVRRTATGARWKVIDAKASQAIKTSHHVQIYFYSLCLQHLLMAPFFEAAGKAGVWLPPEDGFNVAPPSFDDIKSIDLSLLSPSLDTFLFDRLPRLLSLPKSRVKWHFNPLCSGCDYSAQCKRTVIREGRLGTMPNVSINDARVLQEFISLGEQAIEGFERNPPADIEDLHYLVSKKKRISVIESQAPITVQKVRKILALPKRIRRGDKAQNSSSVLDAARAKAVQIIPRRNFTCPSREDIAIVISLVQDPAKPKPCLEFFSISVFFEGEEEAAFSCNGPDEDFVPVLAATIRNVTAGLETPPSTQFYIWSTSEQRLLQSHLIKTALESGDDRSDIRLCIGTLAQGASLLRTTFQPMLLGGALLSFLGKSRRTKGEYQTCLRRMGLDTQGTVPELRARITTELKRLQSQSQGNGAKEAGQIAPVVVLKKEIERLLALPIPGYWDLRECCGVLLEREDITRVPTDDQILSAFKLDDDLDLLKRFLAIRNQAMRDVLLEMRNRIKSSGLGLLVNEGKPVSGDFMDICYNDHLSKLFFMQQFEVFSKLGELWASRIEGSPEAPILEYERSEPGIRGTEHIFHLVDGSIEFQSDRDHAFFDKLLVEDVSSDTEIPVESLFEDLAVAGFVFPLNKWTKPHWESQDARVRDEIRLADIRNMYAAGGRTHVVLRTWETTEKQLIPGRRYRLSSRLVDFNTQKVLATLFEADWQWVERDKGEEIPEEDHRGVPFLQLIMDPKSLGAIPTAKEMLKLDANIQTMFRRLKDLDVEAAGSLLLKPSQHRATQRMLTNRLTVIWGPPGTGKTHTIALSLLRLLEVQWKLNDRGPKIIFVTAMTHAAIDACLSKLERIVDAYRAIESLSTEWLDKVRIHRVLKGHDHPGPLRSGSLTHIYAGTLFQVRNSLPST
ncbi:hypothetical protein CC2G_009317 [Coprinopsis cinerea AmutBmut pab1-1]|nr:hypothetical protein CC2G_009317 [Coprinopsis cinerea AmutBmut pab1-1]